MPWAPSKHLVVAGPYRFLRNPMILGVTLVLIGEALILPTLGIAVFALGFFTLDMVYIPNFKEPELAGQFRLTCFSLPSTG